MSEHSVKVVALPAIRKHPNADSLGLVEIDGFQVVVRLQDWAEGDLAVFVEPDYIVPETELFAFLGKARRIKARRFRGEWSMGLLVPAKGLSFVEDFSPENPAAFCVTDLDGATTDHVVTSGFHTRPVRSGDNLMEQLGIVRYEPEIHGSKSCVGGAREAYVPPGVLADIPKYDLENLRKCKDAFQYGERVIVTEKIHGCNARYTFREGKMWLGSRTRWVEDDGVNVWSRALRACPWIEEECRAVPGVVVYGEVYGKVQSLGYGLGDAVSFRLFDLRHKVAYYDCDIVLGSLGTYYQDRVVPVLYDGPYSFERMLELAEGKTLLGANHIREGIVIKPAQERQYKGGRCAFKLVSNAYLEGDY